MSLNSGQAIYISIINQKIIKSVEYLDVAASLTKPTLSSLQQVHLLNFVLICSQMLEIKKHNTLNLYKM